MQAKTVRSVPVSRLPLSWREFSELQRNPSSKSIRSSANRNVKSISYAQLDLRPDGSGGQSPGRRFTDSQLEHPVLVMPHSCYNPCDSPPIETATGKGEYPDGFEVWA